MSGEIAELGTTRDLSAIAEDLQANDGTLTQIAGGTAQAQTRIQLLTWQLEAGRKRIADREDQLGKLENGIVTLLTRAGQDGEAGLKALEESCQEYQAKASETEARKARILKGRLEGDIRSRYGSEEEKVRELKQQLEQLAPYALTDGQLSGLHTQIEALEKALREVSDKIAGLKRERELREAEQLDDKYEEVVTQAAIAEKNRKEYEAYAFATPGERIDSNRRIEKLRADLKALQNRRAELKVKSDAAGLGQSRIPDGHRGPRHWSKAMAPQPALNPLRRDLATGVPTDSSVATVACSVLEYSSNDNRKALKDVGFKFGIDSGDNWE